MMFDVINVEQGSDEWLELRRTKIGSSDAPVIMGVSPWATPFQLWMEKMGLAEREGNDYLFARGHEVEKLARKLYCEKTGEIMDPHVVVSKENPWMIASLDGINMDWSKIIEIKYVNKDDHFLAVSGSVPEKYWYQVQHQLIVSGASLCDYVSCDGEDIAVVNVLPHIGDIAEMVQKEKEFHTNLVCGIPPELSDRDVDKREDEAFKALAESWKKAKNIAIAAALNLEAAKASIVKACRHGKTEGFGVRVNNIARKGNVDYSEIPELKGVDLENYRKKPTKYTEVELIKEKKSK